MGGRNDGWVKWYVVVCPASYVAFFNPGQLSFLAPPSNFDPYQIYPLAPPAHCSLLNGRDYQGSFQLSDLDQVFGVMQGNFNVSGWPSA